MSDGEKCDYTGDEYYLETVSRSDVDSSDETRPVREKQRSWPRVILVSILSEIALSVLLSPHPLFGPIEAMVMVAVFAALWLYVFIKRY